MAELTIADFSGGLNLTAAGDKIPDRELLQADNVRMDELGNISVAGGSTKQNSSAYSDGGNTNVHSLYLNSYIGSIAGVGNDVFSGTSLSGLVALLDEVNSTPTKMTFADSLNRAIFETGGTPRFLSSGGGAYTIDWAPPIGSLTTTGPNSTGTGANIDRGSTYPAWANPGNITSSNDVRAIAQLSSVLGIESDYLSATNFGFALGAGTILGIKIEAEIRLQNVSGATDIRLYARLIDSGTAVSDLKFVEPVSTSDTYLTFGGSSDLWGYTKWTVAKINTATTGVQIYASFEPTGFTGPYTVDFEIDHVRMTVYSQASSFTVAVGAGGNPNGTYTYKATFFDANRVESPASAATASVSPANQQVDISAIGTGDSKTVGRFIYRKGGTLTFYYRIGEIADNATTTFTDNVLDSTALADGILLAGEAQGDPVDTRITDVAALVKYPALFYDRVFWADQDSGHQNRIIWSKLSHPFSYPAVNFFDVGDLKPVTRLIPFLDDLIIFKADSVWRLSGSDEESFVLTRTPATVGCDCPYTIVKLQDRIIFTNQSGIWYFDGFTARPLTNRLDLFFFNQTRNGISPISLNATTKLLVEATSAKGQYWLSYSDNGSTNNRVLCIDLEGGTIRRFPALVALSIATDPVTEDVYIGDASGFIRLIDDESSATDSGSSVTWQFQTKFFEPQRGSNKKFDKLELYINTGGVAIIPTVLFDNGTSSSNLNSVNTSSLTKVERAIPSSSDSRRGQNISLRLAGTVSTINSSNAPTATLAQAKFTYEVLKQRSRTSA